MLTLLAAIPAIALMVYIYKKDRIEKEPVGLLIKLAFFGALSVISAMILETVGDMIIGFLFDETGMVYAYLDCFIVVAISEEIGKFFALKLGSWNNKAFNFRFDAVVYAVCTSLGFALIENIVYVWDGGVSTALIRAVTAVPAHAIFGVFMGLFYGKAKYCQVFGRTLEMKKNLRLAVVVPVLIHGFYDFCLSVDSVMATLTFYVLLIAMYIVAFKSVKKAAEEDVPLFSMVNFLNNNNGQG